MPCDVFIRFGHYLYSTKCSWVKIERYSTLKGKLELKFFLSPVYIRVKIINGFEMAGSLR